MDGKRRSLQEEEDHLLDDDEGEASMQPFLFSKSFHHLLHKLSTYLVPFLSIS